MSDQTWLTLPEIWAGIEKDQRQWPVKVTDNTGATYLLVGPWDGKYVVIEPNKNLPSARAVAGTERIWRIHQPPKPKVKLYPALMRYSGGSTGLDFFINETTAQDYCLNKGPLGPDLLAWNPEGYPVIEVES